MRETTGLKTSLFRTSYYPDWSWTYDTFNVGLHCIRVLNCLTLFGTSRARDDCPWMCLGVYPRHIQGPPQLWALHWTRQLHRPQRGSTSAAGPRTWISCGGDLSSISIFCSS